MCGICGIIDLNKFNDESKIRSMMHSMKHRGPDDEGIFIEGNVHLGFLRLSIIDLTSSGHQPMFSDDNNLVLVFNGEIYNYIELRNELKQLGYVFKTHSDTEVLLKAYIHWGDECINKFNGMWAFVIYNRKKKSLFVSRDHFGVKPFYYFFDKSQFIFASEISPLLKVLSEKPKVNSNAVFDFLVFNRTDQSDFTFFDGINKLKHGHNLYMEDDKIKIKKWYDLSKRIKNPFKSPLEFKDAFCSAVGLQLRSDVPVGVCLSGGIDSSSIVAVILEQFKKNDISTFSAVYQKGQFGDESEYIDEFRPYLKNMNFINPSAGSLLSDLEDYIKTLTEPVPSTSPYAQYKVMELAKGNVVVTLDGQGADEQMAGYNYFFGLFFKELILKSQFYNLLNEIYHYLRLKKSLLGLEYMLFFLLPTKVRTNIRVEEKGFISESFIKEYKNESHISESLYSSHSLSEALIDHFEFKLEHLLKWEDLNSMHFSIEARVPYLDYRNVESTLSLASEMIIKNGQNKHFLREAMKGILPEAIRLRNTKLGFSTPQDEWFRNNSFKLYINDLINSDSFKNRGHYNIKKVNTMYKSHLSGKANYGNEIWKWIHLENWYRMFID